ncbi:hypothetical protein J7L81_05480 [Candidatus Aerophobetes bacterium]|uniref:Hsp20/alpha crystallin family protein n=1 Tax=Aerophobetes bacterium TaxID=2030807 RepID=A0A7V5HYL9_UNCAE|nr:hypothetical protein [Candidatus Aerophobetes bacterium]HHF98343.1 hypothetical protein [Candidatus Aerophobetes bacterium]
MEREFFEDFENWWEDFDIRIGPFRWGIQGLGRNIRYTRTEDRHIVRIRINPEVKKEEIKAKLLKPGLIEISWPIKRKAEDIPVD